MSDERDLDRLQHLTKGRFFNSKRLDKLEMYSLLKGDPEFSQYLPETQVVGPDPKTVYKFLQRHQNILLKPTNLSRGRGIFILSRQTPFIFVNPVSGGMALPRHILDTSEDLGRYLQNEEFTHQPYLMQPYLSLARINGSPWDIRVVMQRSPGGEWSCTGIECRVAGGGSQITNISQGGQAVTIGQAAQLSFGPSIDPGLLKKEIIKIGHRVCALLDQTNQHYAELGLDLALDTQKRIWFIEANVRPTFNGFRRMDETIYWHICRAPMRYATALAGFEVKR